MTLPDFSDGLLPPGRHEATVDEVRAALVTAFPESTTRAAIHSFWQDRRTAISEHVDVAAEWLDGSFTTDKRDPADIDLITIIDGRSYDEAPRHRRQVVASLVAGTTTEEFWACDANVVVHYPDDDLAASRTAVAAGCWAGYFGHTRDGTPCGLVEVREDGRSPIDVVVEEDAATTAEAQLESHLDRFDRALQAFGDPEATERPGLRLMGDTLRAKRDELQAKLTASRRVELSVRPTGPEPAPARALAAVVEVVCAAVDRLAGARLEAAAVDPAAAHRALHLQLVTGDAAGEVVLRAADPVVRTSVPVPDGHESLIAAALDDLLDELDDGDASSPLHEVVRRNALPLGLELRRPGAEPRATDLGSGHL